MRMMMKFVVIQRTRGGFRQAVKPKGITVQDLKNSKQGDGPARGRKNRVRVRAIERVSVIETSI